MKDAATFLWYKLCPDYQYLSNNEDHTVYFLDFLR